MTQHGSMIDNLVKRSIVTSGCCGVSWPIISILFKISNVHSLKKIKETSSKSFGKDAIQEWVHGRVKKITAT